MTAIFDTHAHYDDDAFNEDREQLLAALPGQGIARVVDVGASLTSVPESVRIDGAVRLHIWSYRRTSQRDRGTDGGILFLAEGTVPKGEMPGGGRDRTGLLLAGADHETQKSGSCGSWNWRVRSKSL